MKIPWKCNFRFPPLCYVNGKRAIVFVSINFMSTHDESFCFVAATLPSLFISHQIAIQIWTQGNAQCTVLRALMEIEYGSRSKPFKISFDETFVENFSFFISLFEINIYAKCPGNPQKACGSSHLSDFVNCHSLVWIIQ